MEYSTLVQESAFGSLSECGSVEEADMIEEVLEEGCWVEASGGIGSECGEESLVVGKRWWIEPKGNNTGPSSSVKERLVVAVGYLKEYTKNSNLLIQIWVPPRRGLHCHTNVSNPDDSVSIGFPMSPNPNPNQNVNVRFFRSHEYQRVHYAQYDVSGCLALPVFERGSGTCLGVIQIVVTNQSIINYQKQLDNVCNPLEAVVDFRSSQNFIPPAVKVYDELYQAALNEIVEVLTSVCKTHNLPLALTWAPCIQQGKCGCAVSTENYVCCVSTVDSACYVADLDILGFQEACSEYHLFRGQGIVGTAFTTSKPCFAIDITAFSKAEYPLAHHAKMFGLHAAVAIPLRSVFTGPAEFVLEFFLPKNCHDSEEQKQMLSSLSIVVQQACRSLHVVMEDEDISHHDQKLFACSSQSRVEAESSWIAHMMEAQQKGKGVSISVECLEEPKEEFKVTTSWEGIDQTQEQVFSDFGQMEQSSGSRFKASADTFGGRRSSSGGRKSGEKRRTKAEKTISLPVLRQYFAGSLKDAAKSIGVCPTTLKRICRQHGITRWPSRKIKKVGHSLKKLQLVIDSVQGAEGAIQIGSFYSSFPELSSADFSASGPPESSKKMHNYPQNSLYGHGDGVTSLKSPPSSCSQTFGATVSTATAGNQSSTLINTVSVSNSHNGDVLMTESTAPDALLRRAHSEAELHASIQEDTKHFSRPKSRTLPPLTETSTWNSLERGAFRVKATFGDEKIRFSLQPIWGFRDLQLEIARRFNLNDISNIVLKYFDDDGEWVVLAFDSDLEECKDLHRSSQSRTIRLSLFQASPLNLGNTFRNSSSPS